MSLFSHSGSKSYGTFSESSPLVPVDYITLCQDIDTNIGKHSTAGRESRALSARDVFEGTRQAALLEYYFLFYRETRGNLARTLDIMLSPTGSSVILNAESREYITRVIQAAYEQLSTELAFNITSPKEKTEARLSDTPIDKLQKLKTFAEHYHIKEGPLAEKSHAYIEMLATVISNKEIRSSQKLKK